MAKTEIVPNLIEVRGQRYILDCEVIKTYEKIRKETAEAIFKELEESNIINTSHYFNEADNWYSCPKSPYGCSDESEGEDCNCGVDRRIKNYEVIKKKFLGSEKDD